MGLLGPSSNSMRLCHLPEPLGTPSCISAFRTQQRSASFPLQLRAAGEKISRGYSLAVPKPCTWQEFLGEASNPGRVKTGGYDLLERPGFYFVKLTMSSIL